MRRPAAVITMLCTLVACAVPAIRLTPAFVVGQTRSYHLRTDATTTIDLPRRATTERSELTARSDLEILSTTADLTSVRITLTFERLVLDGRAAATPKPQTADLVVGLDGTVVRIASVGGVPPEVAGADVADLAPLLEPALPTTRVHLGSTWHRSVLPPSEPLPAPQPAPMIEDGRIAALRIAHGYDCAIVRIGLHRPISRDRDVGGQTVHVEGTELSTVDMAFAFKAGFPVEVTTAAHVRLALTSGTFSGGSLVTESKTTLTLVSA